MPNCSFNIFKEYENMLIELCMCDSAKNSNLDIDNMLRELQLK